MRFSGLEIKVIGPKLGRGLRARGTGIDPDDFDGDGDGLVDDGLLTERPAAPDLDLKPDTDLPVLPDPPDVLPPSRQRGEGAEDISSETRAEMEAKAKKKVRKARRTRAKAASQKAKDLVDGLLDPVESDQIEAITKRKNLRVAIQRMLNTANLPQPENSTDEWTAFLATKMGIIQELEKKGWKFSNILPRISEKGQKDVRDYYVILADRNPAMAKMFERFGIPSTVVSDKIDGNDKKGRAKTLGFYMRSLGLIALDSDLIDDDKDEIDIKYSPDIKQTMVGRSADSILRHEFAHHANYVLEADIMEGKLTDEQKEAYARLQEYYIQRVRPIRKLLRIAEQDRPLFYKLLEDDDLYRAYMSVQWLTTYGHTNFREFWAETLTMLTSRNRSTRTAVPRRVRKDFATMLGFDPVEVLLPYADEFLPDPELAEPPPVGS